MKKILIYFIIVAFIGLFYSSNIEPNMLILREKTINVPNWNKNLNNYKIAVISDLHIGQGKINLKKLKQIVDMTNSTTPDLIVILGDFESRNISQNQPPLNNTAKILKTLKAKNGVIAILGNHDYEPVETIRELLKKSNIKLLENDSIYLSHNGQNIRIIGFKDLWHHELAPENIISKQNKNIPTIVLCHNPDIFPEIPENISLTLSGHTHGGEIYIPVLGAPFVPSKFGQRFRKGYIIENNKHLFVTSGIGTLSVFRFLNPPEIVLLTINSQTSTTPNTKQLKGFHKNYIPQYNQIVNFVKKIFKH